MTQFLISRRDLLAAASVVLCAPNIARAQTRWPLNVTDATGRKVTIKKKPEGVILATGFNLIPLSLIHPDPVSLLAGWASDMKGDNPFIYEAFRKEFPAIENVAIVGNGHADGLSVETALSLSADLAIMSTWQADSEVGQLAMQYLELGRPPGRRRRYQSRPAEHNAARHAPARPDLRARTAGRGVCPVLREAAGAHQNQGGERDNAGPLVLMDAFPSDIRGSWAIGRTGLGELITLAGGRNVASDNLPPQGGPVTAEYVIAADPDVYIATGSPGGTYTTFSVGPGVDPSEARRSLAETVKMPNLAPLKAVREGNVHGMWNFFNAVPLNILAAEAVATWIRPELFGDVDPARRPFRAQRALCGRAFRGRLLGEPQALMGA